MRLDGSHAPVPPNPPGSRCGTGVTGAPALTGGRAYAPDSIDALRAPISAVKVKAANHLLA